MANPTSHHPLVDDLMGYAAARLTPAAMERVGRHLDACAACRAAAAGMSQGGLASSAYVTLPSRGPDTAGGTPPALNPNDVPVALRGHEKYRIIRTLGQGGMGVVYQAEHTLMGRLVAVKVIRSALVASASTARRFDREVKAAASLDHPNVAKAFDAERVGDVQLLVMEYVDGESLADYVARKGPLPVGHACHYIRQAALGLQHAHEKGLVHRDLKPQNLMRTRKGVVKVLDFGLAKLVSEAGAGAADGLTAENAVMGTPQYMPPEQWRDSKSADIRADIYSLGCTLFFLLAGRPPFVERDQTGYMAAHALEVPPPLDALRPGAPPALAALVGRMLAKDPAHRPQTPGRVAAELVPFIQAEAKKSVPPSTSAVPPKPRPAERPAAASSAVAASPTPSWPTSPAGRGRKVWLLPAGAMAAVLAALAVGFFAFIKPARPGPDGGQAAAGGPPPSSKEQPPAPAPGPESQVVLPTAPPVGGNETEKAVAPPDDKGLANPFRSSGPANNAAAPPAAKPEPRPGTQAAAPLLSDVAVRSATTDPLVVKFSLKVEAVRGTTPFEPKARLWFCFGTPSTVASLRAELDKALKEGDDRYFLNFRGPGFVAASCSGVKQDPDNPDVWTGTIDLGQATITDGQVEIPSPFGPTYYKLTEVPISWVYHDATRRLSNELKVKVDLKAGTVVGAPPPANKADDATLPKDGPGDPAATYDLVSKDPAKYRGKRVTWAFTPLSAEGKRMMCALDDKDAIGPKHAGIYVVEFATDREAGDVFVAMAFKPGTTLTGTVAGQIDQFLVVKGPDGAAQKDIPKVTVPLLRYPVTAAGEPAGSKGKAKTGTAVPPAPAAEPDIWTAVTAVDGRTALTDGTISVTFPADGKIEAKGSYASLSIKQTTGAKLDGYLSVQRKAAPADAKAAADPRKWLEAYVRDEVEADRKSVFKAADGVASKNYNDVQLVSTTEALLGTVKGLKAITDHERALSNLKIDGGLHSVAETDHFLVGDYLYLLRGGGSGAPKAAALFGDQTGFHTSTLSQEFFKAAKLRK